MKITETGPLFGVPASCACADPADGDFELEQGRCAMTALHPTECVTFPRSGHHLLVRLLERYFGEEALGYVEIYNEPDRRIELDPTVRFQKNHDFHLNNPIRDDRRYVVQVRYPIDSLVSWFKWECENRGLNDAPDAWVNFALQKTAFWMQFYRKWVLDDVPYRLIVNYADLLESPEATVGRVVRHLSDEAPDEQRLAEVGASEAIRLRNNYRGFKYFGESFFSMLKGFYATVPGIDLTSDQLVVPGGSSNDPDAEETTGEIAYELRQVGQLINDLAERVNHAAASSGASAQPEAPSVPAGV